MYTKNEQGSPLGSKQWKKKKQNSSTEGKPQMFIIFIFWSSEQGTT